jgi:hypothetical protein
VTNHQEGGVWALLAEDAPQFVTVRVQCKCGLTVECASIINTCACGRQYLDNGQENIPKTIAETKWGPYGPMARRLRMRAR